ncbi:hypothetical protein MMC34_005927 [Xylographa carneopallida]|nr:hypothetical protein [Xylographa carneopallida]
MASAIEDAIPKSILKKFPFKTKISGTAPPEPSQPNPQEVRNREIALEHAYAIQQRKDVESSILAATETLLDFPSGQTADPAHPASADVAQVKTLLQIFQPADYDSLVEERNIDGKCGYVLCPRPHKIGKRKSLYRFLKSSANKDKSVDAMTGEEFERWCSAECGEMAFYLRVQLSDVPAWERPGTASILLYGEHEHSNRNQYRDTADLTAVTAGLEQLAIERGEKCSGKPSPSVDISILEHEIPMKSDENAFQEDDYHQSSRMYDSIEGYIPRISGNRARRRHLEDELQDKGDVMDTM